MPPTPSILGVLLAATIAAGSASAQQAVDDGHKFSWAENCGWMNWRGDAAGGKFVSVSQTFLSGTIWCENIGWVSVGTGPADGHRYANTSGDTAGVNIQPTTGNLAGFAWSENAGWINFAGGLEASPPNPARLDRAAGRFRGFAWGENIGWVNLDDASAYVGLGCAGACPSDFNCDGGVGLQDIFEFLTGWFTGNPRADIDHSGTINVQDIFAFVAAWFSGC